MATIQYTKTKFNKPRGLSQEEYNTVRNSYFSDINFTLFEKSETFTEHFNETIKYIKYGFFTGVIAMILININETIGSIISLIAIPLFFFSLLHLILEGPSYASFLKDKEEFELKLKEAVVSSRNYEEFKKMYDNI